MIGQRNGLQRWRRHPRPELVSRYIDDELDLRDRVALAAHLRDCARCRELLESLADMVKALGTIRTDPTPGRADTIVAALRRERPAQNGARPALIARGTAALSVLPTAASGRERLAGRSNRAWAAVRFCLRRAQLRVTVPLAVLIGVALSLVNQGGMLLHGRVDFAMCAMCGANFLLPFAGLNIALVMLYRLPRRRR
jgi:predicted anti-sigma-YlaC factor YlaD